MSVPFVTQTICDENFTCPKPPGNMGTDGVTDRYWTNNTGASIFVLGVIFATEFSPSGAWMSYVNLFRYTDSSSSGSPQFLLYAAGERSGERDWNGDYIEIPNGVALRVQLWGSGSSAPAAAYGFVAIRYSTTRPT